jgi:hypothetical protein
MRSTAASTRSETGREAYLSATVYNSHRGRLEHSKELFVDKFKLVVEELWLFERNLLWCTQGSGARRGH